MSETFWLQCTGKLMTNTSFDACVAHNLLVSKTVFIAIVCSLGGALLVGLLIGITCCICCWRRRKERIRRQKYANEEAERQAFAAAGGFRKEFPKYNAVKEEIQGRYGMVPTNNQVGVVDKDEPTQTSDASLDANVKRSKKGKKDSSRR